MRQRTGLSITGLPRVAATTPLPLHGGSRLREFTRPNGGPSPNRPYGLGTGLSAVKVGQPDGPSLSGPTGNNSKLRSRDVFNITELTCPIGASRPMGPSSNFVSRPGL